MIEIYVDGACTGNGYENSKGGYAVIVTEYADNSQDWKIKEIIKNRTDNVTNNRMELEAILYAMENYSIIPDDEWENEIPLVYSDSAYCVNTLNEWMFNWYKNDWTKSDGKIPENLDLIKRYFNKYQEGYRIDLVKVKGHASDERNNLADYLASDRKKTNKETENIKKLLQERVELNNE